MTANFSKRALKRSVMEMPLPEKSRILSGISETAPIPLRIRRRTSNFIAVAATVVLAVSAAILIPMVTDNTAPEMSIEEMPVITAEGFDTYKKFEATDNNSSTSAGSTGANSNAASNSNSGADAEADGNEDVYVADLSQMLRSKMYEYRGKQVLFRVVVQYSPALNNNGFLQKINNAKSIGALNVTEDESLPKNSRIMELTAEQIDLISRECLKIYLAASDEFYENN